MINEKKLNPKSDTPMNYCINVDWLQVFCLSRQYDYDYSSSREYKGKVMSYVTKQSSVITPIWLNVYNITDTSGKEVATLYSFPRVGTIPANSVSIKLANRILYSCRYIDVLKDIMGWYDLTYKGITRIDVCYDCNYLKGGRSVSQFLLDFCFHQPYCEGHIIRKGSRKINMQAARGVNGATTITGLRWGSPQNDVTTYCYNKSLELFEVKDKPWIREAWERGGLVNSYWEDKIVKLSDKDKERAIKNGDSVDYIKQSVWRFEISIKAHGKDLLNMSTGELFRLDLDYVDTQKGVENIWNVYQQKYLSFSESKGESKIRDYHIMDIFESFKEADVKPMKININHDSGKTERICANTLSKLVEVYSDITDVEINAITGAIKFLYEIAGIKKSIYDYKRSSMYLNHLAAAKRLSDLDRLYIESAIYAQKSRMEVDPGYLYKYWQSLDDAVHQAILLEDIEAGARF